MKALILSDFHLGNRNSKSYAMMDGLTRLARSFDRVILNGDTLDRYEAPECTPDASKLIQDITRVCASSSAPPEIIPGNHDPAISEVHWVYLKESATLVFHGDFITDCTHPSKEFDQRQAASLSRRWENLGGRPKTFAELATNYRLAQRAHLAADPPGREEQTFVGYVAQNMIPPWQPLQILWYIYSAPKRMAALAKTFDQPVRHVVAGHTHRPGRWNFDGITVFNTGSFMPLSAPTAVIVDGEKVYARPLKELLLTGRTVLEPLNQRPQADA
jgi:UDP-2,3-diacylglucosamine pyrophosphatase LpxH